MPTGQTAIFGARFIFQAILNRLKIFLTLYLELVGNLSFGLKKRLFRPDLIKFISNNDSYYEEI